MASFVHNYTLLGYTRPVGTWCVCDCLRGNCLLLLAPHLLLTPPLPLRPSPPLRSALIGGYTKEEGPSLYMVEPSGVAWGYYGCAAGKGKQPAQSELEKLKVCVCLGVLLDFPTKESNPLVLLSPRKHTAVGAVHARAGQGGRQDVSPRRRG